MSKLVVQKKRTELGNSLMYAENDILDTQKPLNIHVLVGLSEI